MLELIERHRVTNSHMVPTQFHRLLALPDEVRHRYDVSSLRSMVHAAAPVPGGDQAADARLVGPGDLGVLRRHRGRRHRREPGAVAGEAGHGRAAVAGRGDPHRRRRGRAAAGRRDRRRVPQARAGRLRVLQGQGQDRRQPPGGLLHRRRRRVPRRGRVPVPVRPEVRHDHLGWREHLPGRDRGRPAHATRASPTPPCSASRTPTGARRSRPWSSRRPAWRATTR